MKKTIIIMGAILLLGILLLIPAFNYARYHLNQVEVRREKSMEASVKEQQRQREEEEKIDLIMEEKEREKISESLNEVIEKEKKIGLAVNKKKEAEDQKKKNEQNTITEREIKEENKEELNTALLGGGMYNDEELLKAGNKIIEKEEYKVTDDTQKIVTQKQDNGILEVSDGQSKSETKDHKSKLNQNKVSFMTDEEEAAYHGYTLEEWEALPDEEKYGTIEGSKGEVKPSGESLGFDWD